VKGQNITKIVTNKDYEMQPFKNII